METELPSLSTSQFRRSKKKYAMFPGTEDIHLDRFQHELLAMITNASSISLSQFFVKNHGPLFQFLLRLYLLSLTKQHPDRGRTNQTNNQINQQKSYTTKEHKIISEWANILTSSPPTDTPMEDEDAKMTEWNTPNIRRSTTPTAT